MILAGVIRLALSGAGRKVTKQGAPRVGSGK